MKYAYRTDVAARILDAVKNEGIFKGHKKILYRVERHRNDHADESNIVSSSSTETAMLVLSYKIIHRVILCFLVQVLL